MGCVGRKCTVDSNLTAIHQSPKSRPTGCVRSTLVNTKRKRKKEKVICDRKKGCNEDFVTDFQFPVWKLTCFGVDSLIRIYAYVSFWPISVVLLDTTSVLGELGWKAYPINGVRKSTFEFSFPSILSTLTFKKMHDQCHILGLNRILVWDISSVLIRTSLSPWEMLYPGNR